MTYKYCPMCASLLVEKNIDGKERQSCPGEQCSFVNWQNPIPVVMCIVETEKGVVLAHNKSWPPGIYSVITGFLEQDEYPQTGAERETEEELGLKVLSSRFIGSYPFAALNQLLMVYQILAEGEVSLNEELDDYKFVKKAELLGWKDSQQFEVELWIKNKSVTG